MKVDDDKEWTEKVKEMIGAMDVSAYVAPSLPSALCKKMLIEGWPWSGIGLARNFLECYNAD